MTTQTCFALFRGWLTVIVTAMFFILVGALEIRMLGAKYA
jgi:hypothetical protein